MTHYQVTLDGGTLCDDALVMLIHLPYDVVSWRLPVQLQAVTFDVWTWRMVIMRTLWA